MPSPGQLTASGKIDTFINAQPFWPSAFWPNTCSSSQGVSQNSVRPASRFYSFLWPILFAFPLPFTSIDSLYYTGFFRETKTNKIYLERHLLLKIGSCGYGGWEIPKSVICKLEAPESQWYHSSPNLKAQDQEGQHPRTGENGCPARAESKVTHPLTFCSSQALRVLDDAYPHWWGHLPYSVFQFKC